jgi:hypothetical protein
LLISKEYINNGSELILWNCGPGIAYDIEVETHLAGIGDIDVGTDWIISILKAAIELETKSNDQLRKYAYEFNNHYLTNNHPPLLPAGIEYGHRTSFLWESTLSGLYIIIRCKDVFGNNYFSVWDGKKWYFKEGYSDRIISEYPMLFFSPLNIYKSRINDFIINGDFSVQNQGEVKEKLFNYPYDDWLEKEVDFVKKNNIPIK